MSVESCCCCFLELGERDGLSGVSVGWLLVRCQ